MMLLAKLRALLWRRKLERELDEELAFHRAMLAEKQAGTGRPGRRFGNELRWREATREAWLVAWVESLGQDLRYAVRSLRRSPGYAATVILMLALGIGANSAIFSLAYGVLWKPLPYPQAERLIDLKQGRTITDHVMVSGWDVEQARQVNTGLQNWILYARSEALATGAGTPAVWQGTMTEAGFFPMLGVRPILGRLLTPADDRPGAPAVVDISAAMWRERWGGSASVIGRTLNLDSRPYTIVGVVPESFTFSGKSNAFWRPWQPKGDSSSGRQYGALARLAPGVTLAQAQRGLDLEMARLAQVKSSDKGWRFIARPLHAALVGDAGNQLHLLLAVVALVLLIASINIACLLLARAQRRARELATRAALGAGRARIARHLLTETALLVGAGFGASLLVAWAGIGWLRAAAPASIPRLDQVALNGPVLGFAAGLSVLVGLIFALAPALRAAAPALDTRLQGRALGPRHLRGRTVLIAVQIGLAVVLLAGSGLLLKALGRMMDVRLGFNPSHLLVFYVSPAPARYPKTPDLLNLYDRVSASLAALPGVRQVAAASFLPFNGNASTGYALPNLPMKPNDDSQSVGINVVGPSYFAALEIPALTGRVFLASDRAGSAPVAVVSQSVARTVFAGKNAIGQRIRLDWGKDPWRTVVGVVGDVRSYLGSQPMPPDPTVYIPSAQTDVFAGEPFVLRTAGDPLAIVPAAQKSLQNVDPDLPLDQPQAMAEAYDGELVAPRFRGVLVSGFGLLALALTAVGLYGLLSYSVGGRRAEFGVRAALGARPGQVMGLVLRQASWLIAGGALAGLVTAWALARFLEALLYGVRPTDLGVYAGAVAVTAAVGLAAAWGPARRAMRVDAAQALREG